MMNKSLRGRDAESSDKRGYGFHGSFLGIQPEPVSFLTRFLRVNRYPLRSKTLSKQKKSRRKTGGFES
jgi:hypothetical protein